MQFIKKFLSYLLPEEESNISFLNWLFRLFLVLSVLFLFVFVLINSVKDTDFGKSYGLISDFTNTPIGTSITKVSRTNREIWIRFKELRDKYDNFYFAYIIQFYDTYADDFVTGLANKEVQIYLWIEPKAGSIIDFSGLEEIIGKRALQIKEEGFNDEGCNKFNINENFYPFLRNTFTNFRDAEELLNVSVCPIAKNSTDEVFAMTAMYYKKVGNYKQLEAAFKSITKKIERSLQSYI